MVIPEKWYWPAALVVSARISQVRIVYGLVRCIIEPGAQWVDRSRNGLNINGISGRIGVTLGGYIANGILFL